MDLGDIRAGLEGAAAERKEAEERHTRATAKLIRYLRAAKESEGISFAEAARLGDISRPGAWKLLDRDAKGKAEP